MEELTLTTPALLFSAVSLILLAYTNRFLSYASTQCSNPARTNAVIIQNIIIILPLSLFNFIPV